MLTYSQNDPQLMSKLLALLQDKDTEHETVRLKFYNFEILHIQASLCAYGYGGILYFFKPNN